jgi:hypothetical protein
MKSAHRRDAERNENREPDKLYDHKGWIRLARRPFVQEWYFGERLNNADEDVEIECHYRSGDEDPAP